MNVQGIYELLRAGGLTRAGALGVMGNMMAESSMKSNSAQRGMTKLTDEQYTAAADNGLIDFVHDSVGYGLCQWTYHTRKAALLQMAKKQGVSVGDAAMQVQFCIHELKTDGGALFDTLCRSDDIDLCSDMFCSQFERPAVNNYTTRRNFAHKFAEEISDSTEEDPLFDWKVAQIQTIMKADGYWPYPIDGHKSKEFFKRLREYINDMEVC